MSTSKRLSPPRQPRLLIVIVNWNSGGNLAACLHSIEQTQAHFDDFAVVVVDNASTDGSVAAVDQSSLRIRTIRNPENLGFGLACNIGAKELESEFILFLNPDTELRSDSLEAPIKFLLDRSNSDIGICGVQLKDANDRVSRTCAELPTFKTLLVTTLGLDVLAPARFPGFTMRTWDHDASRSVGHVIGAFFLVRRSVFEALGGFDTRFFVYFEDIDFSLRAANAGWRSYYLQGASALHEGEGSSKSVKATRLFYFSRSRIQFAWKHLSLIQAAGVTSATLMAEPVLRTIHACLKRDLVGIRNVVTGTALLWGAFLRAPRDFLGLAGGNTNGTGL